MKKSLSKNLIFNVIKSVLSILFPLITLPYISRVLSQESIGEYNYAISIINYYLLISALGIKTFAIKEAGKYRDNKAAFDNFASEMFSLNVVFTLVAYILLGLSFFCFKNFQYYKNGIIIISFSIVFSTLGVEWIFNIFEDFAYITYRSILIQIVSLIAMFTLVRSESDAYIYMAISVIANGGANIFNWFYAKRFCNIKFIFGRQIFRDIVPVTIIFFNTLATVIYVNSDLTMLGIMSGAKEVGIYSVATKLYNTVKAVINSMVVVYITRLASEFPSNKSKYAGTFKQAVGIITALSIPMAFGAMLYSKEIILMLSTDQYLSASNGMILLFISLIFATLGNIYGSGALLLAGREKDMLVATAIGAAVNIVVNYILIPGYGCTGAAIGTLCTEIIVCSILFIDARMKIKFDSELSDILKCLISLIPIGAIYLLYSRLNLTGRYTFLAFVVLSVLGYFCLMLITKHTTAIIVMDKVMSKLYTMKGNGHK